MDEKKVAKNFGKILGYIFLIFLDIAFTCVVVNMIFYLLGFGSTVNIGLAVWLWLKLLAMNINKKSK